MLDQNIALYFESENTNKNLETHVAIEKNKGRVEKRICKKLSDLSWLDEKSEWCGLKTVFSVRRVITDSHKTSEETCYYISSLNASPEHLLFLVREHWKIESMHWMLDVVFAEDFCSFENDNAHITLNFS